MYASQGKAMILRRFSQALKEQNWTAICIEFVLLVLGVFLGIQVANWNNERLERIEERQSLGLLLSEVEQNLAYAQYVIDNAEARRTDFEAALAMFEQYPQGTGNPSVGLVNMTKYRASTPISVTFDDLRSSGKLSKIRNDALRVKLSVYESLILYNERMRADYAARAPDLMSMISPYASFRYDPAQGDTSNDREVGYDIAVDWQAAGKDKLLVNSVIRLMGDQSAYHKRRFLFRETTKELCEALAKELGRKCVPRMD
jgi:hypothetical protein